MTREENTTEFSKNLNHTYNWFDSIFTQKLTQTFSEFWNCDVTVKLISVCENNNILTQREEFFVTKLRLNKELSVYVRLSKNLVKNILEKTLGNNGKNFKLEKLTDLEARILTSFDEFLYESICEYIKKSKDLPPNNTNYNECNLTFFLKTDEMTLGKIVIKIPVVAISPDSIAPVEKSTFSINDFLSQKTEVKLNVGYSKLRLNDIKNIEVDDIVVLENSNSSQMTLFYENYQTMVRVKPNPAIIIDSDFDDNGDNPKGDNMTGSDMYNMWDSIQVDIGAEFEKVKLSLGELKQISEGLVVDIGSVYDNKIDLKVENKIVASGELVIINDRYGVRVSQVFTEDNEQNAPDSEIQEIPEENFVPENYEQNEYEQDNYEENMPEMNYEKPQMTQEVEEDFDYSNFDVDDDDL